MKNTIFTIIFFVICIVLTGCNDQENLGGDNDKYKQDKTKKHLELKATKDKILSSKILKKYSKTLKTKDILMGATTATTISTTTEEYVMVEIAESASSTVEYTYVSDVLATSSVYFEGSENLSNSEYLEKRADNKTPLAFYSEERWAKDDGVVYNILTATTTLEAFEDQIRISFSEKIKEFIIKPSLAATSYTSSGSYTPPCAGNVEVLVVAGGGASARQAGGGGGGGVVYNSSLSVLAQSYTVTVGSGGIGSNTSNVKGTSGSNSIFSTITAIGGGEAGAENNVDGEDGGSGGGASASGSTGLGGSGTASQGYNGGDNAHTAPNYGAGGGGGAGEVGEDGTSTTGGDGGDGISNSISGVSTYYGGGGGGLAYNGSAAAQGNGGNGGGGDANEAGHGEDGAVNTGGGGGSAKQGTGTEYGGDGGSGIIIIVDPVCGATNKKIIIID